MLIYFIYKRLELQIFFLLFISFVMSGIISAFLFCIYFIIEVWFHLDLYYLFSFYFSFIFQEMYVISYFKISSFFLIFFNLLLSRVFCFW